MTMCINELGFLDYSTCINIDWRTANGVFSYHLHKTDISLPDPDLHAKFGADQSINGGGNIGQTNNQTNGQKTQIIV